MHRQARPEVGGGQLGVMRDHRQGAGVHPLADTPDVQVGDLAVFALGPGFHRLADLFDHRVIHLPVQQHLAGIGDQALGPDRDQHRADHAHQRVQPGPAVQPAADQGDDGEHRGGGVGDHVDVGRLQVQVLMVVVPVPVPVPMIVVVSVMVGLAEDQRADQVHREAEHGNDDGLAVVDGLRRPQPLDRAEQHHAGDAEQEDGAGEAAENLDLPGAEGKARVAGVAARAGVGQRAEADGHRVRAHVPAVGQQCHRVEPPAGQDLHHHGDRGDPHHRPGAALRRGVAGVELMMVLPGRQVVAVHEPLRRTVAIRSRA